MRRPARWERSIYFEAGATTCLAGVMASPGPTSCAPRSPRMSPWRGSGRDSRSRLPRRREPWPAVERIPAGCFWPELPRARVPLRLKDPDTRRIDPRPSGLTRPARRKAPYARRPLLASSNRRHVEYAGIPLSLACPPRRVNGVHADAQLADRGAGSTKPALGVASYQVDRIRWPPAEQDADVGIRSRRYWLFGLLSPV